MQTWVGAVQHAAFLPTRRSLAAGCLLIQPAKPLSAAVHSDSCSGCASAQVSAHTCSCIWVSSCSVRLRTKPPMAAHQGHSSTESRLTQSLRRLPVR